jgi:hypothetical protein
VRFYALVIGEGWRFPQAKQMFWEQYDGLWRQAFAYVSANYVSANYVSANYVSANADALAPALMNQQLDHQLLECLKRL